MRRPGPRPYECVRRAWHSDRHQPIRGSLIQEIFRVVNEVHSPATKKNKEWQEKIPVVVLKAEEIMYSKANSEAEYMDLKTLWDRTNDAINTIIRRDESSETGELLQPCIEAALNLGCTQRRASRSQRNINPRCYLSPGTQEPNTFSPGMANNTVQAYHTANSQCMPIYSSFMKPTIVSLTHSGSESQSLVCLNNNVISSKSPFATDNVNLSNNNQFSPEENCPVSNLCSVYPLYYGSWLKPQHGSGVLPKSVCSTMEPVKVGIVQNFFSRDEEASVKMGQTDLGDGPLNSQDHGCDLSLRLGSLSAPSVHVEKGQLQLQDIKDVGYAGSQQVRKANDRMPQKDKGFPFFAMVNVDDPLYSCSSKLSEHVAVDVTIKKRKAVFAHPVEDQSCCWWPKSPCNHLTGRMKSAGL